MNKMHEPRHHNLHIAPTQRNYLIVDSHPHENKFHILIIARVINCCNMIRKWTTSSCVIRTSCDGTYPVCQVHGPAVPNFRHGLSLMGQRKNVWSLQIGFCGTEEFENVMSWQRSRGRNTVTVSVHLFYNVGDQQETVVSHLCCSLLTVKDMQLANLLSFLFDQYWSCDNTEDKCNH